MATGPGAPVVVSSIDNSFPDTMAVCIALDIDPARTTSLSIEATPDGKFVAHWDGFAILTDDQRAAVGAILGRTASEH
jgi:hypothetical protein